MGASRSAFMVTVLRGPLRRNFERILAWSAASGIVADNFGGNRDRAIGMFSSSVPIGSMLGPIIGALIISGWSWRGVFLINLPIGCGVYFFVWRFVPQTKRKDSKPVDRLGVVLLVGALLPLMFGITSLGDAREEIATLGRPVVGSYPSLAAVHVQVFVFGRRRAIRRPRRCRETGRSARSMWPIGDRAHPFAGCRVAAGDHYQCAANIHDQACGAPT